MQKPGLALVVQVFNSLRSWNTFTLEPWHFLDKLERSIDTLVVYTFKVKAYAYDMLMTCTT